MKTNFSQSEYDRRFAAVRRVLADQQLDAVICYGARTVPGMVEYLAGFAPRHEGYLLVTRDAALPSTLLVQLYNHVPNALRISRIADTRWGGADSLPTLAAQVAALGLSNGRIGIHGPIPFARHAMLLKQLADAQVVDVSGPLNRLRLVKSDEELAALRHAAALTDKGVAAMVAAIRPGLRDNELLGVLQAAVAGDGGQVDLCFLASTPMDNPSVCVPAQNLSSRVIEKGDCIITEIGISKDGYAGQIHRPIAVGGRPNATYQAMYDVALEAYHTVCAAIKPGNTAEDVLAAAEIINARGYTICDDLVHGFGGGYLPPVLRTRQTMAGPAAPFVFERNMCIVVQPNITDMDEKMGLQVGQLHVVTDSGLEPLHRYPLEFVIV
jgi:Xaa-Pro dipeptidase